MTHQSHAEAVSCSTVRLRPDGCAVATYQAFLREANLPQALAAPDRECALLFVYLVKTGCRWRLLLQGGRGRVPAAGDRLLPLSTMGRVGPDRAAHRCAPPESRPDVSPAPRLRWWTSSRCRPAASAAPAGRAFDGGKRVKGRKRHIATAHCDRYDGPPAWRLGP